MTKERFVRNRLSPLLVDAYPEVLGASYEENKKTESVDIYYRDGVVVKVDVTGDSIPTLISDVLEKVVFYE